MKKFPTEYTKTELISEIEDSFNKLFDNKLLNTGEKQSIILKIQIAQLQLNNILNNESASHLNQIYISNKKSSKNTLVLSVLMIILVFITVIAPFIIPSENYKNPIKRQLELQNTIVDEIHNSSKSIDTIVKILKINKEKINEKHTHYVKKKHPKAK